MDSLMVLMMAILRDYLLKVDWDLLMLKFLYLMKALNWYILVVKCLALCLEM